MLGSEDTVDLFNYVSRVSIRSSSCEETKKLTYNKYVTEGTEGLITISYTAPETGYYYFYAKGSGCDDIKLNFNGRGNVSYLGKDTNHIIIGGYHVEDEPIEIELTVPEDNEFTLYTSQNYLWYFTLEDYNEIFTKLKSNPQFEISESSTEDNLIGMISTQESDQMILTTIPYDKGWKVYVDGEAVETYETLNALMAFDIKEDGEHLLELKYAPTEYTVGIIISIFGISAFLIICAIDFVLKKTLLKNRLRVYERDYFVLDDFDSVDCPDTLEILESNADGDGVAENADLESSDEESSESCESDESTEE
jgi:uncharacterized membrane protein YfhO